MTWTVVDIELFKYVHIVSSIAACANKYAKVLHVLYCTHIKCIWNKWDKRKETIDK